MLFQSDSGVKSDSNFYFIHSAHVTDLDSHTVVDLSDAVKVITPRDSQSCYPGGYTRKKIPECHGLFLTGDELLIGFIFAIVSWLVRSAESV